MGLVNKISEKIKMLNETQADGFYLEDNGQRFLVKKIGKKIISESSACGCKTNGKCNCKDNPKRKCSCQDKRNESINEGVLGKEEAFDMAVEAINNGKFKELVDLLSKNNIKDFASKGQTLLMVASEKGLADMVDDILKFKPNVNAVDYNGQTALMKAAGNGSSDTVELLIKHGAKKDIKDKNGQTAMDIAKSKKHDGALSRFLESFYSDKKGYVYCSEHLPKEINESVNLTYEEVVSENLVCKVCNEK